MVAGDRFLAREACFPLAPYGKYQHRIDCRQVAVQRQVSVRSATDHQLTVASRLATNHRIGCQHVDRLDDLPQWCGDMRRLVEFEVVEDTVEIFAERGRQLDAGQSYLPSLRVLGRRVDLPVMRAWR